MECFDKSKIRSDTELELGNMEDKGSVSSPFFYCERREVF